MAYSLNGLQKKIKNKAPVNSLLITNILVQIFLISMLFTESAYQFAFSLASSAILSHICSVLSIKLNTLLNEGTCYNETMGYWYYLFCLPIWLVYAAV